MQSSERLTRYTEQQHNQEFSEYYTQRNDNDRLNTARERM